MESKNVYFGTLLLFDWNSTAQYLINPIIFTIALVLVMIVLAECNLRLVKHIGTRRGTIIESFLVNIPKVMMGIWCIQYGLISMIKSALLGSIISNMLLLLGVSIFLGSMKYKRQRCNPVAVRANIHVLFLGVTIIVLVESLYKCTTFTRVDFISVSTKIAWLLFFVYAVGIALSLYRNNNLFLISEVEEEVAAGNPKKGFAIMLAIIFICILIYFICGKIILSFKVLAETYGCPESFLGIVCIPLISNFNENVSAILCAIENRINESLEIAIGSSLQIIIFVAPVLILFSNFFGGTMNFIFEPFQIVITAISVLMCYLIFRDGKTFWFEGATLIIIYTLVMLACSYM